MPEIPEIIAIIGSYIKLEHDANILGKSDIWHLYYIQSLYSQAPSSLLKSGFDEIQV